LLFAIPVGYRHFPRASEKRHPSVRHVDGVALPVGSARRRNARSKTNKRQGRKNAVFEILDQRTRLTTNQIKILAAAVTA
jgi:hypothetical protein